ncbi:hypothetical protein D3C81_1420360 [compost metagenome]
MHTLVAQAESMAVVQAVGDQAAEGAVVDPAAAPITGVLADRQAQVGFQAVLGDGRLALQAEEVLIVDILQLAVVVAGGPARSELVVQAAQMEMIRLRRPGETAVAVEQRQVAGACLVALADLVQPPQVEGQAAHLAGSQQATLEHLREQAAVVGLHRGQLRHQGTDLQLRAGDAQLGRWIEPRVVVRRAPIALHR